MSLVSYYDSNDSDTSDDEDNEGKCKSTTGISAGKINPPKSQEPEETNTVTDNTIIIIPTVAGLSGEISDDEDDFSFVPDKIVDDNETEEEEKSLHTILPKPKYQTEDEDAVGVVLDDTLEDDVKPKQSQMADAPKPPPKRTKQPVRITIPKLNVEDDGEPKQKKQKITPSTQKSGLTALLPPPIHAAKKESNRILVPYSLKKPLAKTVTSVTKMTNTKHNDDVVSKRKMTIFQAMTGYESDSDEDDSTSSNFFSLDTDLNKDHLELSKDLPPCLPSASDILPDDKSSTEQVDSTSKSFEPKVIVNPDAPLGFNSSYCSPYSLPRISATCSSSSDTGDNTGASTELLEYTQSTDIPYPQYDDYGSSYGEDIVDDQQSQVDNYLQDEQFLRLQGKKQRGKEEINIIDANVNDFVNNEVEITKTLTEESEYRSHRKRENQPSSNQKKKHQITYLAFQAKERELELKNAWAQSRSTKRQTQSKYGF